MASSSTRETLTSIVNELFSSTCFRIDVLHSEVSRHALNNSIKSATTVQITELLISIFLSRAPFKVTDPGALEPFKQRFLALWSRRRSSKERDGLSALDSLLMLSRIRLDFQRLGSLEFLFLSVLLYESLKQLSPDRSPTKSTNKEKGRRQRSWGELHAIAVNILSELIYAVPFCGKGDMDRLAEQTAAVWQCLDVLTAGAAWWSAKDRAYRESIITLGKCVFRIPTVEPLLRASMRIDMTPAQVHNIVGTLLEALEKVMGVLDSSPVNAFTPCPLSFPMLPMLDWHNFTKEYEYTSLRVLFVTWLNSLPQQRELEAAKNPWRMAAVLQHTEAFKRLMNHPESGVRVALIYILNQTSNGLNTFKPSTDMGAIQLLKLYITHRASLARFITTPSSSRTVLPGVDASPETCIAANGDWCLPWLWKRRAADSEFVLAVTSAWIMTACSKGRPIKKGDRVYQIFLAHRESGFSVIHDFFRHMFKDDLIRNSEDTLEARKRLRMLFKIVVDLALLLSDAHPEVLDQQFLLLLIRCFINSLALEWIPLHGWSRACEILCRVPEHDLMEAMKLAHVAESAEMFVPLFLREMEAVATLCEDEKGLDSEGLATKLNTLTLQVQFLTILLNVNSTLRAAISRKSYLLKTIIYYISQSYTDMLVASKKAELSWMHAASIASLIELLLVIDFGRAADSGTDTPVTLELLEGGSSGLPTALTHGLEPKEKTTVIGGAVKMIMKRMWEMSYVTGSLCRLATVTEHNYWIQHPFTYLEVASFLRSVLLEEETHKYCIFLPSIATTFESLFNNDTPARQMFVTSRFNLSLSRRLLELLLTPPTACNVCSTSLLSQITRILCLFFSAPSDWRKDLLRPAGFGEYSILDPAKVEKRVMGLMQAADEDAVMWDRHMTEAKEIMKVLQCFENDQADKKWTRMVRGLRRGLEGRIRARVGEEWKEAEEKQRDNSAFYGVRYKMWRPVEGVLGILVTLK